MKLLDFCETIYKVGDRPYRNGFEANQNNIILRVGIVYNYIMDALKDSYTRKPILETVLKMDVSDNGGFDGQNIADLVSIIFDVITDQNLNPELWGDRVSLKAEVLHTLAVLYFGPYAYMNQTNVGPIKGTSYASVRRELMIAIDTSRNPLGI
ncbi:hypothetical protein [Lelliottia amnigena]